MTEIFFCSSALTSIGWVRSTLLSFYCTALALFIYTATSLEKNSEAVIRTRAGWMQSVNATAMLRQQVKIKSIKMFIDRFLEIVTVYIIFKPILVFQR